MGPGSSLTHSGDKWTPCRSYQSALMIIIVIIIIIITKAIIRYNEKIRDKIFRRRLTRRLLTCGVQEEEG